MPQIISSGTPQSSTSDRKSTPTATGGRRNVKGIAAAVAAVGVIVLILGIGWMQGWFGQRSSSPVSQTPNPANADTAVGGGAIGGGNVIGNKKNSELDVNDSGTRHKHDD